MKIINPATEEVIKEIPADTKESLQKKFQLLKSGQSAWFQLPILERIGRIQKFASSLQSQIEECAKILTSEVGKPLQQSRNEVNGAFSRIQWLTENAEKYLTDEVMHSDNSITEKISYEPLGVICNISAWNYPYLVGVNVFVPALLAGNSVLYKPSEYATLTGMKIAELLKLSGIPESVFQLAFGDGSIGETLLEMPFDGYYFTGSYKTGQYIYEKVAPKMVPCQLELGGKDPLYITDDIGDIGKIAAGTADGAFYNNGQSCCAVERIYVHEKVYDKYLEEFVKEVRGYSIADPTADGAYIGSLSRKPQLEFLESQVKDAVSKGAKILLGGKQIARKGYFFEPTVLTEVNHSMSVMKEESFGPIIGIMKVKNDDEALKLMQDTEYGLTASVYCNDQKRAEKILAEVSSGTGYWNCCDRVSAAVPWSGRKHSGFGSTLSHSGIRAFTKPKAYHLRKPG